ncbi:MAG: hypothetical protein ABIT07_06230 [Ferruginibacter sp.]
MTVSKKIKTALAAGLTAAALDISGATIVYVFILQRLPTIERLLQSVAAGAFGKKAYDGGWTMALAGLALHTCIALIFAIFYIIIYPYYKKIIVNRWVSGFFYGIFAWCIMNLVILPAVGVHRSPFEFKYFLIGISLIIFMVGIPIALITDKFFKNQRQ